MDSKEIAKKFLELCKDNKAGEIIPFITNLFGEDKESLKKIIDVQIQIKELGGGWPPVGKQITTMGEVLEYSKHAINYALSKDSKLAAGILNHNVASFCFPNMDDGVDEELIEPGYQAAVRDLEIRKEIGERVPLMWALWLVGVSEFIRGDVDQSIKTLNEINNLAIQEPVNESLAAWADMMKLKFRIKSGQISKDDAAKEIIRIEKIMSKNNDDYGLSTLKIIKEI